MSSSGAPSSKPTPASQTDSSLPSIPSTPATTVTNSGTPAPGQSVSSYLESICVGGAKAANDRDYDYANGELFKTVTPNFRAHFENFPHPLTLAEHSQILKQTIQEFPAYHVEVISVSSDVDEDGGNATVYMETEVTGAPENIKTYLINEFKFRREKGIWRCHMHHGMKGISDHNQLHGRAG